MKVPYERVPYAVRVYSDITRAFRSKRDEFERQVYLHKPLLINYTQTKHSNAGVRVLRFISSK